MRMYVFINAILRPIQQGIQGGHVMVEMATKYRKVKGKAATKTAEMFWQWATEHKTVIFCSAGFNYGVENWRHFLSMKHPYPCAAFQEDPETLGELYTAVGIVVPFKIYDMAEKMRKGERVDDYLTPFDHQLVAKIADAALAR